MKDGGSISLGINEHNNPNVGFTPTYLNQGQLIYYPVNLTDMKVAGQSLNMNTGVLNGQYGALVDSGTTLMILPNSVFNRLNNVFQAFCSTYKLPGVCGAAPGQGLFDGMCVTMSDDDRAAFPTLSFTVPGISQDLTISSNEYLIAQNASATNTKRSGDFVWCLGIQSSPPQQPITILGDTFMRGFYVIFDQESSSVGFGPQAACP